MNKKKSSKNLLRRTQGATETGIYVLLLLLILSASALISHEAQQAERIVYVRYWHFVTAGFFSFILPHLLFPVARTGWLQSLNPTPELLRNMQLSQLYPVLWIFILSYVMLAFWSPGTWTIDIAAKMMLFGEAMLFLVALFLYAFYRFSIIGERSQQWSEGKRGAFFLQHMAGIGQSSATPAGMYPTFGATSGIAAYGMLIVVFQAWLSAYTGSLALIVFGLFLAYSVFRLRQATTTFDRHLYQTSSFYDELFRNPSDHNNGDREPLQVDNVYWVPKRFRASAWSLLLQMDRRLPFGRIMVLMVLLIWLMIYSGLSTPLVFGAIGVLILIKNATLFLSISPRLAPPAFQYMMHSSLGWIFIRFFAGIRWVLPLFLGLLIAQFFSTRLDIQDVLLWTALDMSMALILATMATMLHERRFTKLYV